MTNRTLANVRTAIVLGGAAALTVASVSVSNAMHAPVTPRTATSAPSDSHVTTAPAWIDAAPVNPCKWEDGSDSPRPCYWDSDAMGNGTGNGVTLYGPDGSVWREGSGDVEWVQVTD